MATQLVRVTRPAMGSEFAIFALGEDVIWLESAARDALDRVDWLEQQLSPYLPDSEISRLNARAYQESVPVSESLFTLLARMQRWSEETEGAFDPTMGKLVRLWGFFRRGQIHGEEIALPSAEEIAALVQQTGWRHVVLDESAHTIRFLTPSVELHLGAVGKGYIVQRAADFLREQGVDCALLHSGQSSIVAIGAPPESEGWTVGLSDPSDRERALGTVALRDKALSTSGSGEQFVMIDGRRASHLFDPRSGYPVEGLQSVWVVSADAAEGDALSTAFFVQGADWTRNYCRAHPDLGALLLLRTPAAKVLLAVGNITLFDLSGRS